MAHFIIFIMGASLSSHGLHPCLKNTTKEITVAGYFTASPFVIDYAVGVDA